MERHSLTFMIKASRQALKAALIYVIAASAWILFSDELVPLLVPDPQTRIAVSIIKGWVFVLSSGGLLYLGLRRLLQRWEGEVQQRLEAEIARQQTITRLHQSEEQLQLVMRATADGVWDMDFKTGVAFLSPRFREIIGTGEAERTSGMDFLKKVVPPEDWSAILAAWDEHRAGRTPQYALEYRVQGPGGTEKWIWGRGQIVERAADGTPERMVGTISDITQQKQAELQLNKTARLYQELFENMSEGFAFCRMIFEGERPVDFVYLSVNAAFARLTGLQDVTGKRVSEVIPGIAERDAEFLELYGRVARTGKAEKFERRVESLDKWFAISAYSTEPDTFVAVFDVVTERKRMEASLRESEEKFRQLADNITDVFWICSADLNQLYYISPGYKLIWGRSVESLYSDPHSWMEAIVPQDRTRVSDAFARMAQSVSEVCVEYRIIHLDGTIHWIRDRGFQVHDTSGQVIRLAGIAADITPYKKVEHSLRESEERYRQLFEFVSEALVLGDVVTHQILDVNRAAEQLYGYSREEFRRMKMEDLSAEYEKSAASIASHEHHVPLRWHRRKSGERIAVDIAANVIEYGGSRMKLGAIRDITARQYVLDQLRETAAQLLEAQQIASLGSYNLDVLANTWTGSKALDELFGIEDPGYVRDSAGWLNIVHPEDREEMGRYLRNDVLQGGAPFDSFYRIVRLNDRQMRWVHGLGKLILDDHQKVVRMVGVIQDITEQHLAEEKMNLQFSALTAAANAIVITNHAGKIEWVNPAFSKLTGYSEQEVVGNRPSILKSAQHPPAFYANLWATILTGNVWHGAIINRRKDGRLYTEDMTITPVCGMDGKIAHFIAIKQDITERDVLEKHMLQAQKMEAIGTLAGGIAHDFNNILAAMFGYAYLLQQDVQGNAPAEENIGEILKSAGRAKDLVQQILTFSRQREQKPEVIPLDTVVKEAIKFLRASLPAQIKIELNLAPDAPSVLADATQIYQVTVNLATNALHSMEGHAGCLTVSLDRFLPDSHFIRSHPEVRPVPHTRLTVADTGYGMDTKTLERIFEPFFTTKPVGKGTGLGLAVVHGIVESHHGIITVESEVGRGTTFCLYFPGQTTDAPPAPPVANPIDGGRGQNILVVDDEPTLTAVFKRLLTRLNYRVITSNSAREAIGWCRQDPAGFDLVITDFSMPEINGLEVAGQIHAIRPDLPVILASGFSAELTPDHVRSAGICELLQKPVSVIALAESVKRALAPPG